MADQRIGVSLQFKADTSQAVRKMNELQDQLSAVMRTTNQDMAVGKITSELNRASQAAAQLKVHLQSAFNENTGHIDLKQLDKAFQKSGMTLQKYKESLAAAGPAGQKAFSQLALSIAQSEVPLIRISERVQKLGQAFANTIRWKISNVALEAVLGTITQAYSFAQDLNESLNNIRIVTGKSAEEMDKFAKKANAAAKALSTTTKRYTDASLIYFQQGLSEKEVQKRTDLTVKMANVTGETVGEVSDQLTAVWNNFDDGTRELEYYIDIMVALGAATASSSREISEGLNKFAATAETVGLSYEYAASALATVTATTRESADVVGTAFKTLFARIQDLELGKTLDDGTTLGQYSEALAAVGINIKDVNGEVKDMNTILDEMGAKWNTLNKDAQIALAQNVAGVRQYTQLVALMDNWSYFQENLNTAMTSSGALSEQAKIYEESWEAARDRVTAALESIYESLIDDDAFIDILNFFADFIGVLDKAIEAAGGLQAVLTLIVSTLVAANQKALSSGLNSMVLGFQPLTKSGRQGVRNRYEEMRATAAREAVDQYSGSKPTDQMRKAATESAIRAEQEYQRVMRGASEENKAIGRILTDNIALQAEQTEEAIAYAEAAEKAAKAAKLGVSGTVKAVGAEGKLDNYLTISQQTGASRALINELSASSIDAYGDPLARVLDQADFNPETLKSAAAVIDEILGKMDSLNLGSKAAADALKTTYGDDVIDALNEYRDQLEKAKGDVEELATSTSKQAQVRQEIATREQSNQAIIANNAAIKALEDEIKELEAKRKKLAEIEAQLKRLDEEEKKEKANAQPSQQGGITTKYKRLRDKLTAQNDTGYASSSSVQSVITKKKTALQAQGKKQRILGPEVLEASAKLEDEYDALAVSAEAAAQEVIGATEATEDEAVALREAGAAAEETGEKTAIATGEVGKLGKKTKELPASLSAATKETITFGDKIIAFSSMAMSAVSVLNTLKGVVNIWNDEDMSVGEKALGIFTSILSIMPMLTMAFNAQNVAKLFGLTLDKATMTYMPALNAAKGTNTTMTWLQVVAQNALNAGLLGTIALAGAIIAVFALVVIGIAALIKAFEQEKTAVERASEVHQANEKSLEALNERLKETKKELEDVKTLLDDYANTRNVFDGLIEGSTEWYENLQKQDEIISELLKKYPELLEYGWVAPGSDGLYKIADYGAVQQYVQGQATIAALQAQMGQTAQEIKTKYSAQNLAYLTSKEKIDKKKQAEIDEVNADAAGSHLFNVLGAAMMSPIAGATAVADAISHAQDISAEATERIEDINNNFLDDYEEIEKENLKKREQLEKQSILRYRQLASTLLQNQQGFLDLTGTQREAASVLVGKQLQNYYDQVAHYNVAWDVAVGQEFAADLAKAVNYKELTGWNAEKDMSYNLEHSALGKQVVNDYLLENYGKTLADYGSGVKWTATDLQLNDNLSISLETIVSEALSEAAYEQLDMNSIMNQVANTSDQLLAAITMDFSKLSKEQMDAIGVAKDDGGYDLDDTDYKTKVKEIFDKTVGGSEEDWARYWSDLESAAAKYNATLAETALLQAEIQKGNSYIAQQAELYELETEVVEAYAKQLQVLYGEEKLSYEAAARMAVVNARVSKGFNELNESLEDNLYIIKNSSKASYEWASAATEIAAALTTMFGVEVDLEFVDTYKDKLLDLAEGGEAGVKTFEELQAAAGKEYVLGLNIDEEFKQQFADLLGELSGLNKDIDINAYLNDENFIKTLNDMLAQGLITSEEVQKAFNSVGYSPEITTQTIPLDPVVTFTKTQNSTGAVDEENLDKDGTWGNASWQRIETRQTMQVAAINGEVKYTPSTNSSSGYQLASSSGGGGGSKKKKKNEEIERYHAQKEKLAEIGRELDNIAKAKDRAFGAERLRLLDLEIGKQQELIAAEKEYLTTLEKQYLEDRNALNKYGFGTNADGTVNNYETRLNELIDQRNSGEISEEEYEAAIAALKQYEETLRELETQQGKVIDEQSKLIDLQLEDIEYKVEIKVKVADNELTWLQYQLDNLEDSVWDTVTALNLLNEMTGSHKTQSEAYKAGIKETLATGGFTEDEINKLLSGDFSPAEGKVLDSNVIAALESYRDSLYKVNDGFKEFYENSQEQVIKALDIIGEGFDKNATQLERYNSILNTYQNLIDLVGKNRLGINNTTLESLSNARSQNALASLSNAVAERDSMQQHLDQLRQQRSQVAADDIEGQKYWDQLIDTASEKLRELNQTVDDTLINNLQTFANEFETTVERVAESFEESMTGIYGTYSKFQEAFDQQSEINDRYIDDYKRIYELSKLSRQINTAIDSSNSVKNKTALKELQEEIVTLQQSGAELSQYDLEYLQKKFELRQAEIALEETQNAKSQVRMRRDSEGNWSYVYTADENNIASAQQGYEDALYSIQELSANHIDSIQDKIVQSEINMLEALSNIRSEDYATREEYEAELARITKYYNEQQEYYLDQLNNAISNNNDVYAQDWSSYKQYSEWKLDADSDFILSFENTKYAELKGYTDIATARSQFQTKTKDFISELGSAFTTLQQNIESAFKQVGLSANGEELNKQIQQGVKNINEETKKITTGLTDMSIQAGTAFQSIVDAAHLNYTTYKDWIKKYKTQNEELIEQLNTIITLAIQAKGTTPPKTNLSSDPNPGYTEPNTYLPPIEGEKPGETPKSDWADDGIKPPKSPESSAQILQVDAGNEDLRFTADVYADGNALTADYTLPVQTGYTGIVESDEVNGYYCVYFKELEYDPLSKGRVWIPKRYINFPAGFILGSGANIPQRPGRRGGRAVINDRDVLAFDTGGYTGEWSSDGRIAMLHQKELVLNADDTSKFLSAIEIVRNIAQVIDLRAAAQQSALAAMSTVQVAPTTQTLQQDITIHAEFPNATSHSEIEEAFDTLLNRATQFANRKN